MKIIDLTGKKFGNLTVLKLEGRDKFGETIWNCRCDCGNLTNVRSRKLRTGNTKSCGCLRYRPNRYDLSGDYGVCYFNNGGYFIFDKEDYEKIKDYAWVQSNGYACHAWLRVHRIIMDCPDGMVVDHINHNRLDNRKGNLRICLQIDNMKNQTLRRNNKSGITGVNKHSYRDCYVARINVDGKRKHIGYYKTLEEAAKARKAAEEKYYGIYANVAKQEV